MKTGRIILLVILALILISGTITVCVKGFNVSLDLRAHDTLKFVFDEKFQMSDIEKICDEVFKNKKYELKTVEVFSDAIYIISPEISEDEEELLLEKLDSLYKSDEDINVADEENNETTGDTENTENEEANVENENTDEDTNNQEVSILEKLEEGSKYKLYHDSKVRIRDIVKPYIIPSIISALIILVYAAIKYRKLGNWFILVLKTLVKILVLIWAMLSIIATDRIVFTRTVIPIMMFIVLVFLCIQFSIYEKRLRELDD